MLTILLFAVVGLCGAVVDHYSWNYTCRTIGNIPVPVQCTATADRCTEVGTAITTSRDLVVKALDITVAENLSPNFTLLWQDHELRDYKVQLQKYNLETNSYELHTCISIAMDTTQNHQNKTIKYNLPLPAARYPLPSDVTWKIFVISYDGQLLFTAFFANADNRDTAVLVRRTRVVMHATCDGLESRNVRHIGVLLPDKVIGPHPKMIKNFRIDFWAKNKTDEDFKDVGSARTSAEHWNASQSFRFGARYFIINVVPGPLCGGTGDTTHHPCYNGRECDCTKTPIRLDATKDCILTPGSLPADTSTVLPKTSSGRPSGTGSTQASPTHDNRIDKKAPQIQAEVWIGTVVGGLLVLLVFITLVFVLKIFKYQTNSAVRDDASSRNDMTSESETSSITSLDTRSWLQRWMEKIFGINRRRLSEEEIIRKNLRLEVMRLPPGRNPNAYL